jgi:hypothetical protein
MNLGEAASKCEHIAGVPLRPLVAHELHQLYLAKGVLGTTAIEGNTLSEEQVRQILKGELKLPPSKEYLQQEIENILQACNEIGVLLITHKPIVAFEALDETAKKRSIELLRSLGYCSFLGVSTRTRPLWQRIWGLMKVRKVYLEEISVGTGYSCVIALPHHAGDPKSKATSGWPRLTG